MAIASLSQNTLGSALQIFCLKPQILHDQALVDEGVEDLADFAVLDLLSHLVNLGLLHLI